MDVNQLSELVEQLDDDIDELEERLEPLLSAAFSATTKKLPVLDRAKLYVLVVYTIESLLFSYIRLHGQNAKEHPVFQELSRVRLYFQKIKEAENGGPAKREGLSLNKEAAGRIIKHGLSGNDRYDSQRAEQEAKEKLLAQARLEKVSSDRKTTAQKRAAETEDVEEVEESNDMSEIHAPGDEGEAQKERRHKKHKSRKHRKVKADGAGG